MDNIMTQYVNKNSVEKILKELWQTDDGQYSEHRIYYNKALQNIQIKLDTIEEKEIVLNEEKTKWFPNKKQIKSLKDMLDYNIGVFDYQKFMEVKSLYDELQNIFNFDKK